MSIFFASLEKGGDARLKILGLKIDHSETHEKKNVRMESSEPLR
jgi:hypothetical protein